MLRATGIPYVVEPDAHRSGLIGGVRLLVDDAGEADAMPLLSDKPPTTGKD